jgi:hypothetical protein
VFAGLSREPSSGLEPETPSLPCDPNGNRWQPVATVSPQIKPFSRCQRPERLPPVAPPLFHNCSIAIGPKTRALAPGNDRRRRATTPSVIERGSETVLHFAGHRRPPRRKPAPCVATTKVHTLASPYFARYARRTLSLVHSIRQVPVGAALIRRPPRGRQLPARRLAPRRARARTGRGRWVDVGPQARQTAQRHGFQPHRRSLSAGGGRSVDVKPRSHHCRG